MSNNSVKLVCILEKGLLHAGEKHVLPAETRFADRDNHGFEVGMVAAKSLCESRTCKPHSVADALKMGMLVGTAFFDEKEPQPAPKPETDEEPKEEAEPVMDLHMDPAPELHMDSQEEE